MRIFSLSNGETTVLDTAPAIPPAQKAEVTGSAMKLLSLIDTGLDAIVSSTATVEGTDCFHEGSVTILFYFFRGRFTLDIFACEFSMFLGHISSVPVSSEPTILKTFSLTAKSSRMPR